MIVGRLAPSPTGAQHLGNARTFLVAWLAARHSGGKIILRIEDLDSPRIKPWAVEQAIEDLHWLGLDWDEGPDRGGPAGPYIQTERSELYQEALQVLIAKRAVYPCLCTRSDIAEAASAPHLGGEGPIYPGTCRNREWQTADLDPAEYCFRFRCSDRASQWHDRVAGAQRCIPAVSLGDFPVTRKGGAAAYQLAVVVDDAAMGVTQVVRGDDLLQSTFRQLEIYEALFGDRIKRGEFSPPQFAHLPLVVGKDRRRLAKRHGDSRLAWYRERGVRPQAILGWAAASIGLIDHREDVSAVELIGEFSWNRIHHEPTLVDPLSFLGL